jgi:hypothetical protein
MKLNAHPYICGVVMGRVSPNRKTAEALRRTLQQLEADPAVDRQDPAFISLKCALLARILELENNKAHAEAVIHLVESPEAEGIEAETSGKKGEDSAIA